MNFKRILVTGSEGFIGSHLVEKLVREGYQVRAMVLYNSFDRHGWLDTLAPEIKDKLEVVWGDVRDAHCMKAVVADCDAILHLAALIAIPYSYVNPEAYIQTNVTGTLNVLQAAREHKIKKVVITSTSEVYGTAQFVPITELHPLVAQSPYAASKIAADQLALSFYRSFDCPVAIARPFNTYGPRQSARAVIPAIITQVLNGKTDIELGVLHPTRDFNFVQDTVNGIIAVLKHENSIGEVINIGSNFEVSIGQTVQTISEIFGKEIRVKTTEQRMRPTNSEVERLFASNEKAYQLINWSPEFAGLNGFRKGLTTTVAWFKQLNNSTHYRLGTYTT